MPVPSGAAPGMTARWRRLVVPGTMTLAMLIATIGLGTWQVGRLQWKRAILDRIESAERSPPIPLPDSPLPNLTGPNLPGPNLPLANLPLPNLPLANLPLAFMKVTVTGRFAPDIVALYGAEGRDTPTGPTMGARLIVPLLRDGAATVLVDRGWVPLKRTKPLDVPTGPTTIEGFIHPGAAASWFSATDDLSGRRFYTLDPARIGATLGVEPVAPFVLVALGGPTKGQWPAPARDLPKPANNHLVYAITWYGFAVTLLIVFGIWARKEWARPESARPGSAQQEPKP